MTVRALVFDGLIATVSSSQEEVTERACREVIAAICAQYDVCIAREPIPSTPLFRQYRFFRELYTHGSTVICEPPMLRFPDSTESCLRFPIAAYIFDAGIKCSVTGLMEMIAGPYSFNDVVAKSPNVKIGEPLFVQGFQGDLVKADRTALRRIQEGGAYVLVVERHSVVLWSSLDGTIRIYDASSSHVQTCSLDSLLRLASGAEDCSFAFLPLNVEETPIRCAPPPSGIRSDLRLGLTLRVLAVTCCLCPRKLTVCHRVSCAIVGTDGVKEGFLERKRCCAKNCRIYFYPTFFWRRGEMINTVENYGRADSDHRVLFVSSKLGFTAEYIRSHYCRVM